MSNSFYQKNSGNTPRRRQHVTVIDSSARRIEQNNPDNQTSAYVRKTIKIFAILLVIMITLLVISIKFVEYQWGRRDRSVKTYSAEQSMNQQPAVFSTDTYLPPTTELPPPLPSRDSIRQVPELPAKPSTEINTILRWGKILEEAGELEGAIDRYTEALQIDPGNLDALSRAGRLNIQMSRYQEAVNILTQARETAADNPDILNDLGVAYTFNGQMGDAVKLYNELLERHPDYTPALFNKGYALLQLNEFEKARPLLEDYIAQKPEDAMATGVLAVLELNDKNYDRALAYFDRAIELSPDWGMPYLDAATICATTGKGELAVEYLSRALEAAPPAEIYQRYQTEAFNDIRMTGKGEEFEKRLAEQAREAMKQP